ncbi:flagellar basal body L-ring protein FlgH [Pectinatus haikarae]|uniref:Flagellar L-ring protein FlgH n=1 Tax=Pectinatus haikarae TaxID=349096 RepID=A0ABT9Y5G1_9FIRM|nr:flagellar basal body L-ring protein FlgH [Pectinatus haikarae]MDQ0203065.1 flagellar L-ring protein precursor FlgH [Pectinatus haikarae]
MKSGWLIIIVFFLFAVLGFQQPSAVGQSLWADVQNNSSMSLFADRKAHSIGDILTVVISESSSTSATKSTSNGKTASNSLNAGAGIFSFLAQASAGQSDSFKATGSAKDTNTVSGKITVTVVDVQPNGNMIVEGTQSIWQNKDEHKITLRGVVRQDDVAYDNTISSYLVSDATLKFDGKGPLNAKQRQGILSQIFNILF